MRSNIIERAYELAQSGEFAATSEIVERLKDEGFESVVAHLSGTSIRRQLRSLLSQSRSKRCLSNLSHDESKLENEGQLIQNWDDS